MAYFYCHIRDHNRLIEDLEGVEMSSPKAAFEEAKSSAREILAGKVLRGEVIDGQEFEVHDEFGKKIFTVPFRSVLRLN